MRKGNPMLGSSLTRTIVALACILNATSAAALEWSATEIELLYSDHFREPFNPDRVSKTIVSLQHANGYSLGRNFMFVDMAKSGNQERDLANNPEAPTEVYGEAYTTLSLSRLSDHSLATGPVKDVGLTVGINIGSKNSQLHPKPKVYLAGVTIDFAVPRGFFNVDLLGYQDHGCFDGIASCPNYRATYQITPAWSLPFKLGSVDGEFAGFIDFIGARGAGTVRQVLSQPQLRFDIGQPLLGRKGQLYAGIEYQYWHNKFGNQGVDEHHPQLLLLWKF
jgi:nucleoside-specific outer membrane channel protein Tsx